MGGHSPFHALKDADLIRIALLPDSICGRVNDLLTRMEQLTKSKDRCDGGKQIKKIKLIASPKRIRNITEWNGFKKELDDTFMTARRHKGE